LYKTLRSELQKKHAGSSVYWGMSIAQMRHGLDDSMVRTEVK
jgi:hypothetical protein